MPDESPARASEFHCRPGECIDCCTHDRLLIPVTLSDLYRAWVYDRKVKGERKPFYEVFDERCAGFTATPCLDNRGSQVVVIRSKVPCYNVDYEGMRCAVHGKVQYAGCGLCPEERLLPEDRRYEANELRQTAEFFAAMDCLKGVTLTTERAEHIRRLRALAMDEVWMTSALLSHGLPRQRAKNPKVFGREMRNHVRYISEKAMPTLWMNVRQTMPRYAELYVDDAETRALLLEGA